MGINFKICIAILIFGFWIFNFIGCATVKEITKGVAGVSTKALEQARKEAIVKSFNYDYFTCYTKTLDFLTNTGAYIYAKDIKKHMLAIYISKQDTTAVGIFFKERDASNTQVEVSSPSTYAKELIASKLFPVLEKAK